MKTKLDVYAGPGPAAMPDFYADAILSDPARYLPSEELKNAVNVAVYLGKPLLLTGEPGSGKTHLAHSVAAGFGLKEDKPGVPDAEKGFFIFNTRTTSTALDLFYTYDALGHFQYAQNRNNPALSNAEIDQKFIRYNALGQAIRAKKRCVVLIDEIDKAPRDLPNDILNILEDLTFKVAEIDAQFTAEPRFRPIIILTSNSEKNLPDAFLRRCVYFHLTFPNDTQLLAIMAQKLSGPVYRDTVLTECVLPHFEQIRKNLAVKKPSTSELLYWVALLEKLNFPPDKLRTGAVLNDDEKTTLKMTYTVLVKTEEDLKILEMM